MRKKIWLLFLFCLSFVGSVAWWAEVSDIDKLVLMTNVYSNVMSNKYLESVKKYNIVDSFCRLALSNDVSLGAFVAENGDLEEWYAVKWSSSGSMFVMAMCESWNATYTTSYADSQYPEYFRTVLNPSQLEVWKNVCKKTVKFDETEWQTENCDVWEYSTEIFSTLINDLFKIKWAGAMQVFDAESKDLNQKILDIFERYFNMTVGDISKIESEFPQTVAMIKNDQKTMQKSLAQVRLLNAPSLYEEWILLTGNIGADLTFLNLLMNEYVNYSLFVDYYTLALSKRVNLDDKKDQYNMEIITLLDLRDQMKESIKVAYRELQDFSASYPIHIGMWMYQEKALKLRNNASKLLPPFYALYEKLRNVQSK